MSCLDLSHRNPRSMACWTSIFNDRSLSPPAPARALASPPRAFRPVQKMIISAGKTQDMTVFRIFRCMRILLYS